MEGLQSEDGRLISRRTLLQGAAGLGLAATGGTLLPACGSGGRGGSEARGSEPDAPPETTTIRLFSLPPVNCIAPQYTAERFLREEGFTEVVYRHFAIKDLIASGTVDGLLNSAVDGGFDVGVAYMTLLIEPISRGLPLVMLGGVHLGCWQIFTTGDITSMRDFKGKTVSIVGRDFTDGIFFAMTLANVGLDLQKDVKVVQHPPTEWARILSSREVDGVLALPPFSTDLRARGIGTIILDSLVDPPWSNYYCCTTFANRAWVEKYPVAAKRALRAVLKGAETIANNPDGSARFLVDRGYANNYGYTCELFRELPYDVWRDYDQLDSVRFYALRMKEAGLIDATPEQIIKDGTDFSYVKQLKEA